MPVRLLALIAALLPSLSWGGAIVVDQVYPENVATGAVTQTISADAGDQIYAFTWARLSSETLTQTWGTVLCSFSGGNGHLIARNATADANDNISFDWSGTSESYVEAIEVSGDVHTDIASIVAVCAPRTSANSAGFPYEGATISIDDTFVIIAGQKNKTATSNGATVDAEAGFTEIGEYVGSGTSSAAVWNYVQQTTAANITAGDWDFTGSTETLTARGFTVALKTATAVADGVELTSVAAGSICAQLNATITPDIAVGDSVIFDAVTSPGGFPVTIGADCNFSFASNGLRQQGVLTVYDATAAALMTGSTTVYFGNQPPAAEAPAIDVQLLAGTAMTEINLCTSFFSDFEGDTLTGASDIGGTGSGDNRRPTGTTQSGCLWNGTPSTANEAGNFTFTPSDIAGDTGSIEVRWTTFAPFSFSAVAVASTEDGYILLITPNADMYVCAGAYATNASTPSAAAVIAGTGALASDCEDGTAGDEVALLLDGLTLPKSNIHVAGFEGVDFTDVTTVSGFLKAPPAGRQYIEATP